MQPSFFDEPPLDAARPAAGRGGGWVRGFLDHLRSRPGYRGELVHVEERPARNAACARLDLDLALPAALIEVLALLEVPRLYSHQIEVLEHARARRDIVVVTGTASGKTLAYNLPILEALLVEPQATAFYLFPTRCVAEIVNRFKGHSSRVLRQEFSALRSRLPTLWSRSYYAGTVGAVSEPTIRRTIANQKGK